MEASVKEFAELVALFCVTISVFLLAGGAVFAFGRLVWNWRSFADLDVRRRIWLHFAGVIVLALEFALAADIAETAVAPTWDDIGRLAAIAGIRTFLNLFLERDMEVLGEAHRASRKKKAVAAH
ncbi:DUF1622 domain-containing protein [Brevundimonas lenta]|uniref:Putative membrane protein n=1 Tax=Brevundimonas lenta TaxID=424796 RepID=A0A7W6JAH3_9CAUL|nr:DUF1622 domain-containing protein [Brevundimonas lenta]MBB4081546.1 putative membrane protein [Brevundimonas lenta]